MLLLVDRDVETLHARVKRVSTHCDGHRLAGADQSAGFALLLLVLHCNHVNLLFILVFVIIVI